MSTNAKLHLDTVHVPSLLHHVLHNAQIQLEVSYVVAALAMDCQLVKESALV